MQTTWPLTTCSRRAASVFPTSPPQQDKRARSGTLQLCSASKQTPGETNTETHWGNTRNPPGPGKPRPGSRFSPRPLFLPPQNNDTTRRANDRGKCTAPAAHTAPHLPDEESCKRTGGTREPPKARFPGSPGPPPALPPARGRARAPGPTRIPRRPRPPRKPATPPADTPAPHRPRSRGNSQLRRQSAPKHATASRSAPAQTPATAGLAGRRTALERSRTRATRQGEPEHRAGCGPWCPHQITPSLGWPTSTQLAAVAAVAGLTPARV